MNPSNVSQNPASTDASLGTSPTGESGGVLSDAKQKIKNTARETAAQVKSAATETANRVREQAADMAGERKTEVADRIGAYGSAVHKSAEAMEGEDPNIAWLTHRAADRLNGIADYVRTRDFAQLKGDTEDLARRHPAAFFGGMFVAGLLLGNVLKAAQGTRTRPPETEYEPQEYPRAENVPSADVPETDPWPAEPRAENM
jgi:hypothetical protein